MKLVKFMLNLLYFCVLVCGMFIVAVGVNLLNGIQVGESDTSFVVWSIDENSYGINDAINIVVDNVKTNYKLYTKDGEIKYANADFVIEYGEGQTPVTVTMNGEVTTIDKLVINVEGPKYRCRNWISWDWWAKYPGLWLDYGVDFVASVGSPVILPTYNASNLAKFYNPETDPNETYLVIPEEILTELSNKYGPDYVTRAIQDLYYLQSGSAAPGSAITTYSKWIKAYSAFYDYMFKIAKYNATGVNSEGENYKIFERYYQKIVVNKDGVDDGRLNSNVTFMYYTLCLVFLASLFIIWQYPITTQTLDDGQVEVKGGMLKKRQRRRRGNRKPGLFYRLTNRNKE